MTKELRTVAALQKISVGPGFESRENVLPILEYGVSHEFGVGQPRFQLRDPDVGPPPTTGVFPYAAGLPVLLSGDGDVGIASASPAASAAACQDQRHCWPAGVTHLHTWQSTPRQA